MKNSKLKITGLVGYALNAPQNENLQGGKSKLAFRQLKDYYINGGLTTIQNIVEPICSRNNFAPLFIDFTYNHKEKVIIYSLAHANRATPETLLNELNKINGLFFHIEQKGNET